MRLSGWAAALGVSLWSAAAVGQTAPPAPQLPDKDKLEARAILKQLVEINTTHAFGSTAAAEALKARLLDAGFSTVDLVVIAPPDHPVKGSLVVRFRGKGLAKPVLFIGHLDVVEAKKEDWSVDPFELTQKDGWYYGRGSEDMKSGDAALVETLIRLKRQGFTPDRDIICAFTADEEAGGDSNGPALLLKNHRDLIDAATVFNFDGGGGGMKDGRRLYFEIGTSEKIYLTFTLEATSPGGHGSLPGPDNAIYRLTNGLGRLQSYRFPVITTPTTRASFAAFSRLQPGPQSQDMLAVSKDPADPVAAERLSQTVRLNAQLRTTCVATLISGGHAENALPQRARATIQCRLMPGDTADHVQQALISALGDSKISVTMDAPPVISPDSPLTPEVLARVEGAVHSMWPGVAIVPTMSAGFSDARQTRNAGMPTYNVGGLWVDVDDNRAHGRDERISIQAFDESVEYAYRLMKRLSRAD